MSLLVPWFYRESITWREILNIDEIDFEGTLVLEKLAEISKVDDFYKAIDSDDFGKATSLMKKANVDSKTIAIVLKKMADADGED